MIRAALAALAIALAGCGFMQVGERPIPSVPGAVAATEWRSEDASAANIPELAGQSSTEAFLERLGAYATENGAGEARTGILRRDGDRAVGYVQLQRGDDPSSGVVAYEGRFTIERSADGTWRVIALEVREQCSEPIVAGSCDDNSGGAGQPVPVPTPAATPPAS